MSAIRSASYTAANVLLCLLSPGSRRNKEVQKDEEGEKRIINVVKNDRTIRGLKKGNTGHRFRTDVEN
jgi:hypothetical protein